MTTPMLQPRDYRSTHKAKAVQSRNPPHQKRLSRVLVIEISLISFVMVSALASIATLIPAQFRQRERLASINQERQEAAKREQELWQEFYEDFSPVTITEVIQQQSLQIDPTQQRVVWHEQPQGESSQDS